MIPRNAKKWNDGLFLVAIAIVCLFYGMIEWQFIDNAILSSEEFRFAHQIYQHTSHYLKHDALLTLFYLKKEMAILNLLFMITVCALSKPLFSKRAIALALSAIIANNFYLIYSSELQPTTILSWTCLIVMLCFAQKSLRLIRLIISVCMTVTLSQVYQPAFSDISILNIPMYYVLFAAFFTILLRTAISKWLKLAVIFIFIANMVFVPLKKTLQQMSQMNHSYQQANIRIAESLLRDGSTYVASTPFIYNKQKAIVGIPQLDQLQREPVKLFFNTVQLKKWPSTVTHYLHENFAHYQGSIYLYAPTVSSGIGIFHSKFNSAYEVRGNKNAFVNIDGQILSTGQTIHLAPGQHVSSSQTMYRLILLPEHPLIETPDEPQKMVFFDQIDMR